MKLINLLEKDYLQTVYNVGDAYLEGWNNIEDLIGSLNKHDLIDWMHDMDFEKDYFDGVDPEVLDRFVEQVLNYCNEEISKKDVL